MILILIVALLETSLLGGLLWWFVKKNGEAQENQSQLLGDILAERKKVVEKIELFKGHLVACGEMRKVVVSTIEYGDMIQAERGRAAIAKVELESVELRLRELDEIERELDASELESREELKILKSREEELRLRNEELKSKINESLSILEDLRSKVAMTEEQARILKNMEDELIYAQEQVDELLAQIAKGNDHYFQLKRRYDALDIEYAQLYEKFIGE
jgi:chromosome segregation ATPase